MRLSWGFWLHKAWDQTLALLPVLLLGVLAFGSYWLFQTTPGSKSPKKVNAATAEPDYFLKEFSTRQFGPDGQLKSELIGQLALHFPLTEELDMKKVRVQQRDATGQLIEGSANQALSNKDGSDIQLIGQAKVVKTAKPAPNAPAPAEFTSEYLRILRNTGQVTSNQPVQVHQGANQFSADQLQYDNTTKTIELQGHVKLTLIPQPR